MSTVPTTPKKPQPDPAKKPETGAKTAAKPNPAPEKQSKATTIFVCMIAAVAVIGVLYYFGVIPRLEAKAELDREQKLNTNRVVMYATARSAEPQSQLPLPGTVDAFQQASIYARTTGYVKRWVSDIGDVVHEGDILAELDTPEVDQQLNQAKANVEQAKASLAIAQSAADRWNAMVTAHAVSQEDADEKNATRNVAKATVDADTAEMQRLTELQNFKQIRAPFTGTITFRHIDVGNLVSAGTGTAATGTFELYRIAQTDPLRIYVNVPEANSRSIKPGVVAEIHVPAYPDRVFKGEVVRNAGALDIASRTLHTEIRVANPDGALLPGAYAEVRLNLVDNQPTILIPANTLIVNAAGTSVAMVNNDNGKDTIHLMPVKVGRDFGTEVEILKDLKEGDRLVTNPPADVTEGMVVTAKPVPPPHVPAPPTPAPMPKS